MKHAFTASTIDGILTCFALLLAKNKCVLDDWFTIMHHALWQALHWRTTAAMQSHHVTASHMHLIGMSGADMYISMQASRHSAGKYVRLNSRHTSCV